MFIPRKRPVLVAASAVAIVAGLAVAPRAFAAGETVNVYLTTTSDSGGRIVTRGLQQQTPVVFAGGGGGSANQTITVNEDTIYQPFEGAGASMTDTAAFDLRGSGALSAATQNDVLTKLFSNGGGIGVSALRNVIGSSDLAQNSYSYDTTCCDLNDFSLSRDADIMALTKQAYGLNPSMFVMASPWSAPPWM
jgi:glucosylceramidase